MDADFITILAVVSLARAIGRATVLALLVRSVVRACVARTRPADVPALVHELTGLVGALERPAPRRQGVREIAAPLHALQASTEPAPAPRFPAVPGQAAETKATSPSAGGAR
ncbi:hypothetical protein [Kitasatospora sp. NPDC001225]